MTIDFKHIHVIKLSPHVKVTLHRDDSQRRSLVQHIVAMLGQCCNYSKQCRNNVATLY